ncbi:MAG: adenylate/guanylate cyclase domain-containing protein [Hyphomicrobiaceae bacterium]
MSKDENNKPSTEIEQSISETKVQLRKTRIELDDALSREAATAEILRVISGSPMSAQRVFEAIVNVGLTLFPDATISIALRENDAIQVVAIAGPDPVSVEAWRGRFPAPVIRETMHGNVILDSTTVDVPDVAAEFEKFSAGATNFLASGYRAVTMMPISQGDDTVGVLALLRIAVGPLSKEQFALLEIFAAQANIAIGNTHLVNELRDTNDRLANVSSQLARYIPPQLFHSIFAGEQQATIDSRRKKLTIFFSDIVDFTEITDQLEAEELTSLLNEYLAEMADIAQAHDAYFDKFIGDAMMFYFGDPISKGVRDDASACARMAISMQRRLSELQAGWRNKGLIDRPFEARMGINTGYCTVGNFGSADRMDYTIIGGEVNLAARLEEHADSGGILLAAETYSLVRDWLEVEEREALVVKGRAEPIRTYAVRGIYDQEGSEARSIRHESDGFFLAIEPGQLGTEAKANLVRKLRSVISELEN